MIRVKFLRIITIWILIIGAVVWLALGPGLRKYLETNKALIISELQRRSDNHAYVENVSGDFFSGIVLEKVTILTDLDPAHRPFLQADRVVLQIPISAALNRDFTPSSVHIDGFTVTLHIAADGSVAVPEWKFQSASDDSSKTKFSGLAGVDLPKGIKITLSLIHI